ncbi:hypothetical protein B0H11DRAFT_1941980 [Mycena galericulata]|nr:hypothetical protein B0H11DRAFT_1941980 [Mycena galericulata]
MPAEYEVLHSRSWWKDFHANRRRRRAQQANFEPNPPFPIGVNLETEHPAITFVPGRSTPIYSRVTPHGSLVPLPGYPAPEPHKAHPPPLLIPTTATHACPPSKVVSRYRREKNIPVKDADAELLAKFAASRARSQRAEEKKAAAKKRVLNANTSRAKANAAVPEPREAGKGGHYQAGSRNRTKNPMCATAGGGVNPSTIESRPSTPAVTQRLYLVTGGKPEAAGAYATWNTAAPNSQGVSAANVKAYGPDEREAMYAAWYAACERGEHAHPGRPPASSPSAARVPQTPPPAASPAVVNSAGLFWTPTPAPKAPKSPSKKIRLFTEDTPRAASSTTRAAAFSSLGKKMYAVRSSSQGWVYTDAEDARKQVHALQDEGHTVEMTIATGFTRAVAFAERRPSGEDSAEGRRRREWAQEENRAHRQRLAAEEARAREEAAARAAYRVHIIDELQYYREDDSDSDHSSDGTDSDRSTGDLERELNLRVSNGSKWRAARDRV